MNRIFFLILSLIALSKITAYHLDIHGRQEDIEDVYRGPPRESEIIDWANEILNDGKNENDSDDKDSD